MKSALIAWILWFFFYEGSQNQRWEVGNERAAHTSLLDVPRKTYTENELRLGEPLDHYRAPMCDLSGSLERS
jgi:hypothetical protein